MDLQSEVRGNVIPSCPPETLLPGPPTPCLSAGNLAPTFAPDQQTGGGQAHRGIQLYSLPDVDRVEAA